MQLNDTWMTFKLTGARIMEKVILNYKGEQHELTTDKVPEIGTSKMRALLRSEEHTSELQSH